MRRILLSFGLVTLMSLGRMAFAEYPPGGGNAPGEKPAPTSTPKADKTTAIATDASSGGCSVATFNGRANPSPLLALGATVGALLLLRRRQSTPQN